MIEMRRMENPGEQIEKEIQIFMVDVDGENNGAHHKHVEYWTHEKRMMNADGKFRSQTVNSVNEKCS